MVDPVFPEATIGPLFYIALGILMTLFVALLVYTYRLKASVNSDLDLKQLNMSPSRITILEELLSGGVMQNELPKRTGLSKATVSQSVKELDKKKLVKRKKRGNTYLIEIHKDVLEEKCKRPS